LKKEVKKGKEEERFENFGILVIEGTEDLIVLLRCFYPLIAIIKHFINYFDFDNTRK
jgi:hypothetical protein